PSRPERGARALLKSLERGAIPVRQLRAGRVGALQKLQQRGARRLRLADVIVHQNEFGQILMPESSGWLERLVLQPCRLRRRVGIECRARNGSAARPEPGADALVRVGFTGDHPLARRSGASRETRTAQVEAAPKKVHGTALADEPRAEFA